jgi:hypothetical protein
LAKFCAIITAAVERVRFSHRNVGPDGGAPPSDTTVESPRAAAPDVVDAVVEMAAVADVPEAELVADVPARFNELIVFMKPL